jgi:hypothetical protein
MSPTMTSASHMLNAMSSYDEQDGPGVEAQPLPHMRSKFAVSRLAAVEVFAKTRGTSHSFASPQSDLDFCSLRSACFFNDAE